MIAIYARISKSDTGSSIENQIGIVKNYLSSEEIMADDIKIFIDDGYSGRCSCRPAFVKMLAGVATGEIKVIAVKDFSRFGRNHLFVSELTEVVFKRLNVRFISVADTYDSYKSNDEMLMAFRSIFNEYYCVDVSNKIKSVLYSKNVSGDYAISKTVYGYKNAYKEIDAEEAEIIKAAFCLVADGNSYSETSRKLNDIYRDKKCNWQASDILRIIKNPEYTGSHVWNKYSSVSYLNKRGLVNDRNLWKIDSDVHEAIVSEELYQKANQNSTKIKSSLKSERHIFSGLTKCMKCRYALSMDKRKMGWLVCTKCAEREQKIIKIDDLYNICIGSIKQEFIKKGITFNYDFENDTQTDKRNFLNNFIKTIYAWADKKIEIYWKFGEE